MAKFRDLTGMRFGRLTVMGLDGRRGKNPRTYWKCVCDCGETVVVRVDGLTTDHTQSCGCFVRERASKLTCSHGKAKSVAYRRWITMLQRCYNENSTHYHNYGGRGIKVCKRWCKFENFYADMGDPPRKTTLDRIDVNGNYEPGNCRWATRLC